MVIGPVPFEYPDQRLKGSSVAILSKVGPGQKYSDVTDATVALANAVFRSEGRIVTPYNALTTPLMFSIGNDYLQRLSQDCPLVDVVEARGADHLTEEIKWYVERGVGRVVAEDAADFLSRNPVSGVVFIGGDDGFYKRGNKSCKFAEIRRVLNGCPVYPLGASGGAAKSLLDDLTDGAEAVEWRYKDLSIWELYKDVFTYLATRITADISGRQGRSFLDA